MSSNATAWGDWEGTMTEVRIPHWLSKTDRTDLAEAIVDLCRSTTVFPTVRDRLDAVLIELGVAEARDQVWPHKAAIVRQAHGYAADVLPIRISDQELLAVLTLPALPPSLRQQLGGSAEKE